MSIDGFLQFLGLVVAVYALFNVVNRYRLRLLGWKLWLPTLAALLASIYLLLFEAVGVPCHSDWCRSLEISAPPLTPNILSFLVVLAWLVYVALLSRTNSIRANNLPMLAALVDRLVSERRFSEVVDFVEPHISLISRVAGRQLRTRKWRDSIRFFGNPFLHPELIAHNDDGVHFRSIPQSAKRSCLDITMRVLKSVESKFSETSKPERAADRILQILHTNDHLIEFVAIYRPLVAVQLMGARNYDFEFSDRVVEVMMSNPKSALRKETLLNQNVGRCFYEIDIKNDLIYALFKDCRVAEQLEVYRPVGNYPLRLLERNEGGYKNIISSAKPADQIFVNRDPAYAMIKFFDIMVRSAIRDGIEWHMWLMYYDILVRKLIVSIDFNHPDFDDEAEFPNFAYYLIYEIFSTYNNWLKAVECCDSGSPAVRIDSVSPTHDNGSIHKSTMLSVGNSLSHLLKSEKTPDKFITYILEIVMRNYSHMDNRANAGLRAKEAFRNAILSGGYYGLEPEHLARLRDCYADIDHPIIFDTRDFNDAMHFALAEAMRV